jgi:uncharacterized protein YciI
MAKFITLIFLGISTLSFSQEVNHVFVFLNSKPDKAQISEAEQDTLQAKHMKNIERLVAEGKMIVAGPFENGGGIFIFKSGSASEVRQWLSTDPAVKANRWDIEIYPIRFFKGGPCLATEPYEMVTYKFTRVRMVNDIANYKMNKGNLDIWNEFTEGKNIIMVGAFPQSEGGLIVQGKESHELSIDEAKKDFITFENKLLWVAKGSFCE